MFAALLATALTAAPFELDWRAPPTCAARPEVSAPGAAQVVIEPVGPRFRLVVRFLRPFQAERALETDTCEEAAQAARLLLELGAHGTFDAPAPSPPLVETSAPLPEPEPATPTPRRLSVGLVAGADVGLLPTVMPQVGADAALELGRFAVGLSVSTSVVTTVGGPAPSPAASIHPALSGALRGCLAFTVLASPRLTVFPCAELRSSLWLVTGRNITTPASPTAGWLAIGPSARATVDLTSRLDLSLVVSLQVSVVRASVFVEDAGDLVRAGAVVGSVGVLVGWHWGPNAS